MSSLKKKVGVLALQGAYALHRAHIEGSGGVYQEVVCPEHLDKCSALIIPGGESSTMVKLIDLYQMWEPLKNFVENKPTWGICAGAILLANRVVAAEQKSLALIDIAIQRNAYGRQMDSFEENIENYQVSFIRAPKILKVGKGVRIKAERNGNPVWIESKQTMITTFHPELNRSFPSAWHQRLLDLSMSSSC